MANERKVFEIDVQTGESGKRVKDVDQKLTELRAELTKAQAALKDFKTSNKDDKSLVEQSATYQQLEGNLKKIRSEYGRLQNEQQGIKSNTTGLTNALKEAAREISAGLASELKKANQNLEQFIATQKESTGTVDTQSSEYKVLQTEVQRLTKDYEVLQAEQNAVNGTTDKFTAALDKAANDLKAGLTVQLEQAQQALRSFLDENKDTVSIAKQTAEFKRLESEVERLTTDYTKLEKAQSGLKSTSADISKAVSGVALKFTAGIAAVQGLTSTISNSVEAYGQSEAAQKQLEVALGFTSDAILNQSTALAQKTKFDDDAIVSSAALLAQQKLTEEQIQTLLPAILDLSEAQGVDLATATDAVAVSIVNGSDKLKKYGIDLDGAAGSNERVSDAVAKLNDRFGEQAEAAAKVGTGPLVVFKNNLGNLEEVVGGLIVSAINPFLGSLTELAQGLTDLLEPSQSAVDAFHEQDAVVQDLTTNVSPLLDRYDELASKTTLTAAEQAELKSIVDRVSKAVPLATSSIDDYGNALAISTTKAREFVNANIGIADVKKRDAIIEQGNALQTLNSTLRASIAFEKEALGIAEATGRVFTVNGKQYITTAEGIDRYTVSSRGLESQQKISASEQSAVLNLLNGQQANYTAQIKETSAAIIELSGQKLPSQLAAEADAANATTKAQQDLDLAYKNQTATLAQLNEVKKSKEDERSKLTEADTSRLSELNAEIAAIDTRIKLFTKESEVKKEAKKTDSQTFNENIKALEEESSKELAIIKLQEDAKTITTEQAETRRLEVTRSAAQKRADLTTEFAAKGGFTVDEIANIAALQTNADEAEKIYQDFLSKLEQDKSKADNVVAFQFDQINLQQQLESDLAAFDAFSAAKAKEEESIGLDAKQRDANQKERDAERLKILQAGNAAVLQSQLEFINAQIAVLQKVQASGKPFTEEQKKQLDELIAQARELKTQILQATSQTTQDDPEAKSFLGKLFDITDEQAKAITDKAIALAQQIGQAVIDIARQNNAQQLSDTTNRVNSEYGVAVDALKSQQEAGLLTAAEFEARRKKLEDDKNAKLLAAKQKAFKANQKAALAEVALNTAVAVTAALRGGLTPVDRAIAVAFAIAQGVIQAVVIKQQQPPQFGQGGQLPQSPGRTLYGPSHAAGGVPIYDQGGQVMAVAEGGEFIASKAATEKFLPIFQGLNDSALGNTKAPVPRVAAFEGTSQSRSPINKNSPPQEIRAYVVEADITSSQRKINKINAKAEIGE